MRMTQHSWSVDTVYAKKISSTCLTHTHVNIGFAVPNIARRDTARLLQRRKGAIHRCRTASLTTRPEPTLTVRQKIKQRGASCANHQVVPGPPLRSARRARPCLTYCTEEAYSLHFSSLQQFDKQTKKDKCLDRKIGIYSHINPSG